MSRVKRMTPSLLFGIGLLFLLLFCQTLVVHAEDTAVEDESGNIVIRLTTNSDVDALLMSIDGGEPVEIGSETEYRDEHPLGNNQSMDIDGDMFVTEKDKAILKAHIEGRDYLDPAKPSEKFVDIICKDMSSTTRCSHCGATDINGDGKIDTADLTMLENHLKHKCTLDGCYFHGVRTHREEIAASGNDPGGFIWRIYYTPVVPGTRTISFVPLSYVTDVAQDTRRGEEKSINVHAEEYKNPEVIKTYAKPNQNKFLVYYKSNTPTSFYVVTPLETDSVKLTIKNELNAGDKTVVDLTEWDSIDYAKAEKTWKYDYVTNNRGWRTITAVGYGKQTDEIPGGVIIGESVDFRERIVDPLTTSGVSISSYVCQVHWRTIYYSGSYTDAEGNSHSYSGSYDVIDHYSYMNTARVTANEDTDYVIFSGLGGGSGSVYSYSGSSASRTFTSNSWVTEYSPASGGSAEPKAIIGLPPVIKYEYDVTFFPCNEGASQTARVEYDKTLSKPADPTRVGYVFKGWFKDDRGIDEWVFASDKVKQTTMLYAKWEKKVCVMSFDTHGGSAVGPKNLDYNTTAGAPGEPTREGYVFGGWYKDSGCSSVWNFVGERVTSDVTIHAKWTPITYNVSFDTKGGSSMDSIGVVYNGALPGGITPPTMTGFTFDGWFKDTELTKPWGGGDRVTGDITLYAKWKVASFKVTFDACGGSVVAQFTGNYNTKVTKPANPTRAGYTFMGWYKELAYTNEWYFGTYPIVADTTLHARWKATPAYFTFNTGYTGTVPQVSGFVGDSVSNRVLPVLNRAGYHFDGWFTAASGGSLVPELPSTFPLGTTTYYAHWSANVVTISFYTDFGSSIAPMKNTTGTIISNRTLPTTTRAGYTFIGFYRTSDFSGNPLTELPAEYPTKNTTYYVKWVAD